MEYIIFCICSVIVARYVEKKSRVVSIAHDVLFIVLSLSFFFATNNPQIVNVVLKVVDKDIYTTIHHAFVESSFFIKVGFSSLFIIEAIVFSIIAFAACIIFIKGLKEVTKRIRIKTLNDIKLIANYIKKEEIPKTFEIQKTENKHLLNCKFQN